MKVLVTGAAGYLGSVLTWRLLGEGYGVIALDSFTHNLPSLSALTSNPKLKIVCGDARNTELITRLLKSVDAVVALAAVVGAAACAADEYAAYTTNFGAVRSLCDHVSHDQLVLYPNTNSGYGVGGEVQCTEDSPLRPVSHYGRVKVVAERQVLERAGVSFRFATLFGASPRMRLDLMVNDFVYRAVRDRALVLFEPKFRRNFLHVQDAAGAFLHALEHPDVVRGQVYNAGDTRVNMTKGELCEQIQSHVPGFGWSVATHASDPDKRDYIVSNAKLEATGWRPMFTLQDGIAELVRCYAQPFDRGPWRNA